MQRVAVADTGYASRRFEFNQSVTPKALPSRRTRGAPVDLRQPDSRVSTSVYCNLLRLP
jgi:hypothetical protein